MAAHIFPGGCSVLHRFAHLRTPILLQTTDMPPLLLGLVAGVVAGAVLASINGSVQGLLLVLACAFVGTCLCLFGYLIPRFGLDLGGPTVLADAASYVVLLILFSLYLALPAGVGVGLVVLVRSLGAKFRQG
jgi:hypothetical protein